jgi:Mannosyltransferase (PIG-V)
MTPVVQHGTATDLQIPNFALAAPAALIAARAVWAYAVRNPGSFFTLGKVLPPELVSKLLPADMKKSKAQQTESQNCFASTSAFVYVAQLAGMLAFGVFFIHVQVSSDRWPNLTWSMLGFRGAAAAASCTHCNVFSPSESPAAVLPWQLMAYVRHVKQSFILQSRNGLCAHRY